MNIPTPTSEAVLSDAEIDALMRADDQRCAEWVHAKQRTFARAIEAKVREKLAAQSSDYRDWYNDAMKASNEAGFVGMSAGDTIRALAAPVAGGQAAPAIPEGETLADRLDWLADRQTPGSQTQSDLFAAATIWRKHLKPSLLTQAAPAARELLATPPTPAPAPAGGSEAVLWQARIALKTGVREINNLGGARQAMPLHYAIQAIDEYIAATASMPAPATGGKGDNHG